MRSKELHCRQGWGEDHWDVVSDDIVLEVRVREPNGRDNPRRLAQTAAVVTNPATIPTAEAVISAWGGVVATESTVER